MKKAKREQTKREGEKRRELQVSLCFTYSAETYTMRRGTKLNHQKRSLVRPRGVGSSQKRKDLGEWKHSPWKGNQRDVCSHIWFRTFKKELEFVKKSTSLINRKRANNKYEEKPRRRCKRGGRTCQNKVSWASCER